MILHLTPAASEKGELKVLDTRMAAGTLATAQSAGTPPPGLQELTSSATVKAVTAHSKGGMSALVAHAYAPLMATGAGGAALLIVRDLDGAVLCSSWFGSVCVPCGACCAFLPNDTRRLLCVVSTAPQQAHAQNQTPFSHLSFAVCVRVCSLPTPGTASQVVKVWTDSCEVVGAIRAQTTLMAHKMGPVTCMAWHPYQPLLAAGGGDSVCAVYAIDQNTAAANKALMAGLQGPGSYSQVGPSSSVSVTSLPSIG